MYAHMAYSTRLRSLWYKYFLLGLFPPESSPCESDSPEGGLAFSSLLAGCRARTCYTPPLPPWFTKGKM